MGKIKTIVFGGSGLTEEQEKWRKLFMYLVSGFFTTLSNWVVYIGFDKLVQSDMTLHPFGLSISLKIAAESLLGWVVSVLVAYFLNRITVFRSKGNVFRELLTFFGARIITFLILELGVLYLMVWGCESITGKDIDSVLFYVGPLSITFNYMVKLCNSVLVIIANYIMSKLMVFKKEDMAGTSSDTDPEVEEAKNNA